MIRPKEGASSPLQRYQAAPRTALLQPGAARAQAVPAHQTSAACKPVSKSPAPSAGTAVPRVLPHKAVVQRFEVVPQDPNSYGAGKSRFAAHYRKLAANTTVDDEKSALVLASSNVATFKLIRRKVWEQIAALAGSPDKWHAAKKAVRYNKMMDVRFVTLPSDPQQAHTAIEGGRGQLRVKSAAGHSEQRIISFIRSRLAMLGILWPAEWVVEWVYTERAPCTTRAEHHSGYKQGCSDLLTVVEREQNAVLRVYYTFTSKKVDSHAAANVKTRIRIALQKIQAMPQLSKDSDRSVHRQRQIIAHIATAHALDHRLRELKAEIEGHLLRTQSSPHAAMQRANRVREMWLKLYETAQQPRILGANEFGQQIIDGDHDEKRRAVREILLWFATDGLTGAEQFVEIFSKAYEECVGLLSG